jgi:hypothetical protein
VLFFFPYAYETMLNFNVTMMADDRSVSTNTLRLPSHRVDFFSPEGVDATMVAADRLRSFSSYLKTYLSVPDFTFSLLLLVEIMCWIKTLLFGKFC